jgi:NAD+ synthetase
MNLPVDPYFVEKNIKRQTCSYIRKHNIKSLVLGISGGLDSAVVASLMAGVAAEESIPLIGISLPSDSNQDEEIARADAVGKEYCTKFTTYEIDNDFVEVSDSIYLILSKILDGELTDWEQKILAGNIKARLRMILLFATAGATKGMVLSTDNKTEEMLGFWTLHGDVGNFGPIQNLWKSEVYELARSIYDQRGVQALKDCIDATPTDGLGITSSDLDQIGVDSYDEADRRIQNYIKLATNLFDVKSFFDQAKAVQQICDLPINDPVINRMVNSEFKRKDPYNIPRDQLFIKPNQRIE